MRRLAALPLALLLAALPARPAAPPRSAPAEKWTIDDIVLSESVSDVQVSPDGRWAAWVKAAPDKEKNEHVSHLWRTDLRTGREVQLTRGTHSCTSPRWSPDGSHLAFLSSRPAPKVKAGKARRDEEKEDEEESKTQLWVLDATGGEPWQLTEGGRSVQRFAWAGDEA